MVSPSLARTLPRALFLLPLLLASCAVMLVGPYDPVTDAGVQELAKETEVFIAEVTLGRESYGQHAQFYRQAEGSIRALELRAGLYPKNESELAILANLRQALANLRRIHQEVGPFRSSEAEPVRSLLRTLLHHQLSKKRSAGVSAPKSS